MKEAAVTVPTAVEGRVTPPVGVRTPAGERTTVPAVPAETATLPKFMSTVFEMLIGVTMVAVAVAVAVAWANVPVAKYSITIVRSPKLTAIDFVLIFIYLHLFVMSKDNRSAVRGC